MSTNTIADGLRLAEIVSRHELLPLAIISSDMGSQYPMIRASELDHIFVLGEFPVAGHSRSFSVEGENLFGSVQFAIVDPEVGHH